MGVQRRLIRLISPGLKIYVKYYFKKTRFWKYKDLKYSILPTVFFPHFTHSTKILLGFLETLPLNGKTLLELGCGIGAVSVLAAKKGAKVVATDINPVAAKNAQMNGVNNGVKIDAINSDLFDNIPPHQFDYIMINPPYYPKKPVNDAEYAWFCGEDFDYFKRCFKQLANYFNANSEVYMILSEDCELDKLIEIASENRLSLTPVYQEKIWGEFTVIYSIQKID
ncbi:methyltransferase [Crocinitomix catalasitica]|uniref:methyltransferase n=1 Tax=Crocinitomix catalasitica TaxID=184607 RepID=UPI0005665B35|nr:methyltransferase [Crocinitomix catalasitica]